MTDKNTLIAAYLNRVLKNISLFEYFNPVSFMVSEPMSSEEVIHYDDLIDKLNISLLSAKLNSEISWAGVAVRHWITIVEVVLMTFIALSVNSAPTDLVTSAALFSLFPTLLLMVAAGMLTNRVKKVEKARFMEEMEPMINRIKNEILALEKI